MNFDGGEWGCCTTSRSLKLNYVFWSVGLPVFGVIFFFIALISKIVVLEEEQSLGIHVIAYYSHKDERTRYFVCYTLFSARALNPWPDH